MDDKEVGTTAAGAGIGTMIGGPVGTVVGAGAGWLLGGGGKQLYNTVSGHGQDAANAVTGTLSPAQQAAMAAQIQAPDQGTYQINGLNDYQNTMQGLGNNVPGAQDYQGANAGQMGNQEALQRYFQNVGMGTQNTAADQMFQNSQQQAGQQLQSGMLAQGGMNPALGMRQMANSQAGVQGQLASKSAAQKFQEQAQGAQLAQQGSQALVHQRMAQMQQNYTEQMQGIQAKKDIANGIFSANRAQTSLNVDYAQNRTAYQQFIYGQGMQAQQNQAAGNAAAIRALMNAGGQAGAAGLNAYGRNNPSAPAGNGGISPEDAANANAANGGQNYQTADNPYMNGPNSADASSTPFNGGSISGTGYSG